MNDSTIEHIAVLADKLAEQISLPSDGVMVDATIGHGSHSYLFGQTLGPKATIVGFDLYKSAIKRAKAKLSDLVCKVILVNSNFSVIAEKLREEGLERIDFILADLGVCSAQWADADVGLSLQRDMPLDMRFDKRLKTTAADIVNNADEKTLADIIYKFGQDRASRRIARFIVQRRQTGAFTTTSQLASVVCKALARPGVKKRSRIHPATRTFQALRIAVNHELENLEALLEAAPVLLNKNGYLAIISYHSLEDRLVKYDFRENKKQGIYEVATKKPIVPSKEEIALNRRARSAKLRIARRR